MLEAILNRELKIMEVLSFAVHTFLGSFKQIFKVLVFIFLPLALLNAIIFQRMNSSMQVFYSLIEMETLTDMESLMAAYGALLGNQILQMMVFTILEPIGIIAVAKIVRGWIIKEEVSVKEAIGESMSCLGKVIFTGVPYLILVILGFLFFFIPGIYLSVIWTFYVYAVGLRGEKGWSALKYSGVLTKNRWWKTIGFVAVITLFLSGWNWMLSMLLSFGAGIVAVEVLYQWLAYFTGAIGFIAMTILFFNREAVVLGRRDFAVTDPSPAHNEAQGIAMSLENKDTANEKDVEAPEENKNDNE